MYRVYITNDLCVHLCFSLPAPAAKPSHHTAPHTLPDARRFLHCSLSFHVLSLAFTLFRKLSFHVLSLAFTHFRSSSFPVLSLAFTYFRLLQPLVFYLPFILPLLLPILFPPPPRIHSMSLSLAPLSHPRISLDQLVPRFAVPPSHFT